MSKKYELHRLIHSLSKSEKRYFRMFCSQQAGSNNYLKLFDKILSQDDYDEQAIKRTFHDEKFIRQLHVTKSYLRHLILKSLRNFHSKISRDAELKDGLRNVEILYNKELFTHCESELRRAENLARRFESLPALIEIENWKRKLEQNLRPHNYEVFKKILIDQEKIIKLISNTNVFWQLTVHISDNLGSSNIKDHPLLRTPDHAATLEAKVLFYNASYLMHLQKEDVKKAYEQLSTLIDLLEKYPERINEEPGLYVSSINNLISYLVFVKDHDEALKLIQKAKRVYDQWRTTAVNRTLLKQIIRTYNIELEIYRNKKSFGKQVQFINSIERFVEANHRMIPKEYLASFWFQLASINFMRQDFHKSLHWINKLLNARFQGIRIDLHVQTHLLNLMVHLEQNNMMVLRYCVDSTRRYMKKVGKSQLYEKLLLRFFIKIGRLPVLDYKQAFMTLRDQLFPEGEPSLIPDNMLGYIDYEAWIDSKLYRKKQD